MANEEHLAILRQGVKVWNAWREEHPDVRPALSEANLGGVDLYEANLSEANLNEANLSEANLDGADLRQANLCKANLRKANLSGALLDGATLVRPEQVARYSRWSISARSPG